MTAQEDLEKTLRDAKALPVLFAGSGVSHRYLGTPTWSALLEHFAPATGKSMAYYRGLAGDDLPRVASLIAADFYEPWFKRAKYRDSRKAFESSVRDVADPLKYEICKYLESHKRKKTKALAAELSDLERVRVHAVLTTNWDLLLDEALDNLEVFVGQQDVLFAQTQAVGELYKIHGSLTDPTSLVLTEEDYTQYWARNPYLIAKILTLFVEHPMLLIGYSMTDAHIQKLFGNLISCLTTDQLKVLNGRLIFVKRAAEGQGDYFAHAPMTIEGHTLEVQEVGLKDFGDLYRILANLPQRMSVKLLRQVKRDLYQLAFNEPAQARVFTVNIEDDTDLDKVEVVIGVGTMAQLGEKGYAAFDRQDLFADMVNGGFAHNEVSLIEVLLPRIFKQAKFAPVYYPLHIAGRVADDRTVKDAHLLPARARHLLDGTTKLQPYQGAARPTTGFADLLDKDPDHAINLGVACTFDEDDVVALRDLLHKEFANRPISTELAKLGCKYDALVYGPDFLGDRDALSARLASTPLPALT